MSLSGRSGARREIDEDEIIGACRKGEPAPFEMLVDRYQKQIFNLAFRLTGSYEDACNVAQETFLSAYRSLRKYRGETRFLTWLYSIALNRTRDRLSEMSNRELHEGVSVDDPSSVNEGQGQLLSEHPGLAERVEGKEISEEVQACLNGLTGEHREILVLRDIQGFSCEEIAGLLDLPDGTVKSGLFRARLLLTDALGKVLRP